MGGQINCRIAAGIRWTVQKLTAAVQMAVQESRLERDPIWHRIFLRCDLFHCERASGGVCVLSFELTATTSGMRWAMTTGHRLRDDINKSEVE